MDSAEKFSKPFTEFVSFPGLLERHPRARSRVPELPQEQPAEGAEAEQGGADVARQRRAGAEEGAGEDREGASPAADGGGRGGLQKADRSEEGQASGVLAVADRRVHQPVDGHGEAAQEGPKEEGARDQEEAEAGWFKQTQFSLSSQLDGFRVENLLLRQ